MNNQNSYQENQDSKNIKDTHKHKIVMYSTIGLLFLSSLNLYIPIFFLLLSIFYVIFYVKTNNILPEDNKNMLYNLLTSSVILYILYFFSNHYASIIVSDAFHINPKYLPSTLSFFSFFVSISITSSLLVFYSIYSSLSKNSSWWFVFGFTVIIAGHFSLNNDSDYIKNIARLYDSYNYSRFESCTFSYQNKEKTLSKSFSHVPLSENKTGLFFNPTKDTLDFVVIDIEQCKLMES